jgi:hypothetical protein
MAGSTSGLVLGSLKLNGGIVVLLSATDLHCGWTNDAHDICLFAMREGGVANLRMMPSTALNDFQKAGQRPPGS